MADQYSRTRLLLGDAAMERLRGARVAVFGVGGVGGYVCEALARSGVGHFDLTDSDTVSITNINRQIIATLDTVGRYKVDVMAERMHSINPDIRIVPRRCFFLPENQDEFPFESYDYVVDAVDTMAAKVALVMRSRAAGVPIICSMGAGNKLDGSRFRVCDLFETTVDPLARVMRREMRSRGVESLKVVWSDEPPMIPMADPELDADRPQGKRATPGSCAFVPSVAGLILAGEVVRDLIRTGADR